MKVHYVVAIAPPNDVIAQLQAIRTRFAQRDPEVYNQHHDLVVKVIPPFLSAESIEHDSKEMLAAIARNTQPFTLQFDGYGFSEKQKIFSIKGVEHATMTVLHQQVRKAFEQFKDITILYRGTFKPYIALGGPHESRPNAKYLWTRLGNEPIQTQFLVASFCLWKRVNKKWVQVQEFKFT